MRYLLPLLFVLACHQETIPPDLEEGYVRPIDAPPGEVSDSDDEYNECGSMGNPIEDPPILCAPFYQDRGDPPEEAAPLDPISNPALQQKIQPVK